MIEFLNNHAITITSLMVYASGILMGKWSERVGKKREHPLRDYWLLGVSILLIVLTSVLAYCSTQVWNVY